MHTQNDPMTPTRVIAHGRAANAKVGLGRMNVLPGAVNLYWLPLGAGETSGCVRWNGRAYESFLARCRRREPLDLYHSALEVQLGPDRFVIEMTPVWATRDVDRGVVSEGPVGVPWLGHSRYFRYEVRRWRDGTIPDASYAVGGPRRVSTDPWLARRVLDLVPAFPTATWGRDELRTGEMWNSNSLVAWLLTRSGHDTDVIRPPRHGRAPGWSAGSIVAARQAPEPGAVQRSAPQSVARCVPGRRAAAGGR
jgi:hypothetical protein